MITATIEGGSPTDREFVTVAWREAVRWVSQVIGGEGDAEFLVKLGPLPLGTLARTTPGYFWYDPPEIAHLVPGATYEAQTGIDANGADPDAVTEIDVAQLARTPNAIYALMHEIVHAYSFNGGGPGSSRPSLFDDHVQGFAFVGEFATAAYGGPVPLSWDLHHVLVPGDVMYPSVDLIGGFTAVSIAILQDSGVPIVDAYRVA